MEKVAYNPNPKNCPFCGMVMIPNSAGWHHLVHDWCPISALMLADDEAELWNRRTPPTLEDAFSLSEVEEALRSAWAVLSCAEDHAEFCEAYGTWVDDLRKALEPFSAQLKAQSKPSKSGDEP